MGSRVFKSIRGDCPRPEPLPTDPRAWFDTEFGDSVVTVVGLFAGAGGLSHGFDSIDGMSVVAAFEHDLDAGATHAANHRAAVTVGDVRDVGSFEIVLKELGIRRVDVPCPLLHGCELRGALRAAQEAFSPCWIRLSSGS